MKLQFSCSVAYLPEFWAVKLALKNIELDYARYQDEY